MNLLEKLELVAENQVEVYEAGAETFGASETRQGVGQIVLENVHPQEHDIIVSVPETKNILDVTDGTILLNSSKHSAYPQMILPIKDIFNKYLTLSMEVEDCKFNTNFHLSIYVYTGAGTAIENFYTHGFDFVFKPGAKLVVRPFRVTEFYEYTEESFLYVTFDTNDDLSDDSFIKFKNIQLEFGETATEYEPCIDLAKLTVSNGTQVINFTENCTASIKSISPKTTLTLNKSDVKLTADYFVDQTVIKNNLSKLLNRSITSYSDGQQETIGSYTFANCKSLLSVEVPSCTRIEDNAFMGCNDLDYILLGKSLTSIGDNATTGCSKLTNIYYGGSSKDDWDGIVIGSGNDRISEAKLFYYSSQEPIAEGDYWHYVNGNISIWPIYSKGLSFTSTSGGYAVSAGSCTDTTVVIPPTYEGLPITEILSDGFKNHAMISVEIPNSVTRIGGSAFSNCNNLTSIEFGENSKLLSIDGFAFYKSGLTSIEIPNGVTRIGMHAFLYCSNLTNIEIPDSVTTIAEGAFYNSGLTSIKIPNSTTSIGNRVCSACQNLTSITVAEGNTRYHSNNNCLIETMTKTLISGCITSVIPSDGSVTHIGQEAFNYTLFTNTMVPNGVTHINDKGFYSCYKLTTIEISSTVTSIGNSSFEYCRDLSTVIIQNNNQIVSLGTEVFSGCASDLKIYVPAKFVEDYKVAENWSTYADKIIAIPGTEEPDVTLITFTVNDVSYQAEEGMTWDEWINSEYKPVVDENYFVSDSDPSINMVYIGGGIPLFGPTEIVRPQDVIISDYNYTSPVSEE